jgi:hypothetical protein
MPITLQAGKHVKPGEWVMVKIAIGILGAMAIGAALSAKDQALPTILELHADEPMVAEIEGVPARLQITTGLIDRLTLHTSFVAANGIKPAPIAGKANVNFWGRKEIQGKNRPLDYAISGQKEKGRAFWFGRYRSSESSFISQPRREMKKPMNFRILGIWATAA